jgi:hypothetical protein
MRLVSGTTDRAELVTRLRLGRQAGPAIDSAGQLA